MGTATAETIAAMVAMVMMIDWNCIFAIEKECCWLKRGVLLFEKIVLVFEERVEAYLARKSS